ncbi:PREDICTED: replication protein A 70 kDa DNA-binding subunit B-like [Nicotiana attenuata]|uniref:replication protein A 70 kDa DNA-binding subunit B-like n=1 Tax=Nicotiana attenuata TaxID=49451 RepID=UPI000904B991|nr:PREDICTED: replication protein A 70 kDa DNA-binding subunit B-like [Nicotiana attenuata]
MATQIHDIKQISGSSMQWNLKVRVVRMWVMPDRFKPEIPYSIQLCLQDSKGDRIHASIRKYVLKFFRNKIHELRLYRMNYFVVGPNNLKLRTTTHHLRLTFTQKTFVEETNDPSFHMNIFNLRPFDNLRINKMSMRQNCVTKIWINSTLPQSTEFKSRLLAARPSNIERITQTSSQQSYSVRDELDKGIESSCWIAAELVSLELDRGWSYLACNKCSRKVDKVENKYICKKCNEDQFSCTHRYRLQVRVMDGTAFISLLLWNREAMQLIGRSAKELKESSLEVYYKTYFD